MNYSFLYCYPRSDAECWGYAPPGTPSVDQFIQGEPYWKQEERQSEKQKRTLVLCDWALTGYNNTELKQCFDVLFSLLEQKFKLYAFQSGDVVQLTQKNLQQKLSDLSFCEGLNCTDRTALIQTMASHDVAADEIGILDYFACQQLFFNDQENRVHSFHVMRSDIELDLIVSSLCQNTLARPIAVHNEFKRKNERFKKLLLKIPGILEEAQIKVAIIESNLEAEYFINNFGPEQLIYFEELICRASDFHLSSLATILARTPNIEMIDLTPVKNLRGETKSDLFEKCNLSKLETLYCPATLHLSILGQLLSKSSGLKKLIINSTLIGKIEIKDFEKINLSKLEELDFRCSTENDLLGQILSKAPNLKRLEIRNTRIHRDITGNIISQHLEVFICRNSQMDMNLLGQILILSPKLKEIIWEYSQIQGGLEDEIYENKNLFWNLKQIRFYETSIIGGPLGWILSKSPQLEHLGVSSTKVFGPFESKHARLLDLRSLKLFDCSYSSIDQKLLGQILAKAPHLTYLNFTQCMNISGEFEQHIYEAIDLKFLEELYCSFSNITIPLLLQILENAPFIKNVDIAGCGNLNNVYGFVKKTLQLEKLEEIDSRNTSTDPRLFAVMIKAPNLKKIDGTTSVEKWKKDVENRFLGGGYVDQSSVKGNDNSNDNWNKPNPHSMSVQGSNNGHQTENATISSKGVDADPGFQGKLFATLVFVGKDGVHPAVRDYRKDIYYSLKIKENIYRGENPFEWCNESDFELTPCADEIAWMYNQDQIRTTWQLAKRPGHKFFFGIVDIPPSSGWRALDSLSPEEKISHMCVDKAYFDIKYAKKPNLYFVKNTSGETLKAFIILSVPNPISIEQLNPDIHKLIERYDKKFDEQPLELQTRSPTGRDYLQAIISHPERGACRHRAVGFYSQVKQLYPHIEARANLNGIHANVELQLQGRWVICDLGGAPADLVINETNHPHLTHRQLQISKHSTRKESIEEYFQHNIVVFGKNSLVEVHSSEELKRALGIIQRGYPNVRYVEEPCYLDKMCPGLTNQNVLVVNLSTFDGADLQRFIDLTNRTQIPMSTCLIGLYILKGSFIERTEDFLDLFHNKLELLPFEVTTIEPPPPPPLQIPLQIELVQTPPQSVEETDKEEPVEVEAIPLPTQEACEPIQNRPQNLSVERISTTQPKPIVENLEDKRRFTQALLERKVLETLWNITSTQEVKFTLKFNQNGEPTNFTELVDSHILLKGKNVHIAVHSAEELDLCTFWLQRHIEGTYYIDKPEEIRCSSKWIDEKGVLKKGPGGLLYNYIMQAPRPVFIVNFSTFEPDDIVRCNPIYDNGNREADGVLIPQDSCVIGLSVTHPKMYKGKDFTDRFYQRVALSPFSTSYPIHFEEQSESSFPVDLFGITDWKQRFLGKWTIEGNHFVWKKGILEEGHSHIQIQNGQWDNRDFRLFWQQVSLQKNLVLSKIDSIDWNQFRGMVTWIDQMPKDVSPLIINPSFLGQMEVHYQLQGDQLIPQPGCIEMSKNSTLYAYLTCNLKDSQWYQLLKCCKENKVILHILAPQDIHCPVPYISLKPEKVTPAANIIVIENIDVAVRALETQHKKTKCINVSECDNRLMYTMDVEWISELEFRFKKRFGALHKLLKDREHVILWGNFSGSLIDALMPLLLHQDKYEGQLTIVTDSNVGFELFKTTPYTPREISTKLYVQPLPELRPLSKLHPFEAERLKLIWNALNKEPHVCIDGDTGVGKTTFIRNILAKIPGISVFIGEESLVEFAKCCDGTIPIFFDDEVNLKNKKNSRFEGLYQLNPSLVIDEYYPLTPLHRVISAKNPLSFGGERREVSFLLRHPNHIEFTPLSNEYLLDVVLDQYQLPIKTANIFLEVYKKAQQLTPRELEMMALITLAVPERDPLVTAYRIAKYALSKKKQEAFHNWFTSRFGKITLPTLNHDVHDFILTESRQEAYGLMSDFLAVRKLRQRTSMLGGLGGIVFEGIPRDGKSHFAVASLLAQGFVQVPPDKIGTIEQDAFCLLPANMPVEQKKECLLAAFHAGQLVIENEMNASPGLEALHNGLAMGYDQSLQKAKKPGFGFIGTQNPIFFAGRRATTSPSKHRVITYELTPYGQREMFQIVHKKYPLLAQEVIRLLTQKQLSFGELLNVVEKGIRSKKNLLDFLPDVVEQQGPVCKLYALSTVMMWIYKKNPVRFQKAPPPARKRDPAIKAESSVRQLAKQKTYSQVGEVYSPKYLVELAKSYGYNSTFVVEASNEGYTEALKYHLDQGAAPIVFFDVEMNTGMPIKLGSNQEHAAVCVGYFYNLENELFFTLLHWGKPWVVKAQELAESAANLSTERDPETFYKVDGAWRQRGDRQDVARGDYNLLGSKKIIKKTGKKSTDSFRNKIVIVA
jgi:hypothetical protein